MSNEKDLKKQGDEFVKIVTDDNKNIFDKTIEGVNALNLEPGEKLSDRLQKIIEAKSGHSLPRGYK